MLSEQEIYKWLSSFLWPFFRILSFLMVVPFIGVPLIPARIKIILAAFITLALLPELKVPTVQSMFSLQALSILLNQLLIGIFMGLALQLIFQVFQTGGEIVAQQSGISFASMVDPMSNISMPVVSQLYLIIVTLIFIGLDGHLILIKKVAESFSVYPMNLGLGDFIDGTAFLHDISWVFKSALSIGMPAITGMLVLNTAMALITRATPQIHIHSISFPLMLLAGMVILLISLSHIGLHFENAIEQYESWFGG